MSHLLGTQPICRILSKQQKQMCVLGPRFMAVTRQREKTSRKLQSEMESDESAGYVGI